LSAQFRAAPSNAAAESVSETQEKNVNAQPEETQNLNPHAADAAFVEIQAVTRADAERLYGAVFDQPEPEINHG
jgi:hypothetical protein